MIILSQRDPRWAKLHYGATQAASGSTIGAYGCAITALAMWLNVMLEPKRVYDPIRVQDELLINGAYLPGSNPKTYNLVDWERLPRIYPLRYAGRIHCVKRAATTKEIEQVMFRVVDRKVPIILYVDIQPDQTGFQQHFVLATGVDSQSRFVVADPWYGDEKQITFRYTPNGVSPSNESAMSGSILLDYAARAPWIVGMP